MHTLDDLYRQRNALAFKIEHGQPELLTEYAALQQLILLEGRRWCTEYEARVLANLRRSVSLAVDTPPPAAPRYPVWDGETL